MSEVHMKYSVLLLLVLMLASCTVPGMTPELRGENEATLAQFAIPGQTTNRDVLLKYKKPVSKLQFSDGRYSYIYYHADTKIETVGIFDKTAVMKMNYKSITFVFGSDNVLQDAMYNNKMPKMQSKYASFEQRDNETARPNPLWTTRALKFGESKGTVLRTLGTPTYDSSRNGVEELYYAVDERKRDDFVALVFTNSKLSNLYRMQTVPLNEQENAYLQAR